MRNRVSPTEPRKRAAKSTFHMNDIARQVCATFRKDCFGHDNGAQQLRIPRGRLALDAADAIYPEATKLLDFRRGGQTMFVYLMEFDVLREKAVARLSMGGGFPDESASILFMQNATLARSEESLALTSIQSKLALAAAAMEMRLLFGSRGNAARQDVLPAEDVDTASDEEGDYAAGAASEKAKKEAARSAESRAKIKIMLRVEP